MEQSTLEPTRQNSGKKASSGTITKIKIPVTSTASIRSRASFPVGMINLNSSDPAPSWQLGGDMDAVDAEWETPGSATRSFKLKWSSHAVALQDIFRKLLTSHQFSDVTLICEGERIKCHRMLLAACSPYFEDLFTDNDNLDNNLIIYLKGMKAWEVKALVKFLYTGQVSVEESQLRDFLKAAEALNVKVMNAPNLQSSIVKAGPVMQEQSLHGAQPGMNRRNVFYKMPKLARIQYSHSDDVNNVGVRIRSKTCQQEPEFINEPNSAQFTGQVGQMVDNDSEDDKDNDELESLSPSSSPLWGNDFQELQNIGFRFADLNSGHSRLTGNDEVEDDEGLQQYEGEDSYDDRQMKMDNASELGDEKDDEALDDEESPCEKEDGEAEEDEVAPIETERLIQTTRKRGQSTWSPELQEMAFDAIRRGMSIRQCSEVYGISRKALAKWKKEGHPPNSLSGKGLTSYSDKNALPMRTRSTGTGMTGPEADHRARRLQMATELAMKGVTVRQAAAHHGIPRTTLCAYMKRLGLSSQARNVKSAIMAQYAYQQQRRVLQSQIMQGQNPNGDGGNYGQEADSDDGWQAMKDIENGSDEYEEIQ